MKIIAKPGDPLGFMQIRDNAFESILEITRGTCLVTSHISCENCFIEHCKLCNKCGTWAFPYKEL